MPKEHILATKIKFVVKNSFRDKFYSSLKLLDMLIDHVLARKINFVSKKYEN